MIIIEVRGIGFELSIGEIDKSKFEYWKDREISEEDGSKKNDKFSLFHVSINPRGAGEGMGCDKNYDDTDYAEKNGEAPAAPAVPAAAAAARPVRQYMHVG